MIPGILAGLVGGLVRVSLEAAVVTAVVVSAQRLLHKWLAPQWRYALWALVALRLIFVWSVPAPLSVHNFTARAALDGPSGAARQEVSAADGREAKFRDSRPTAASGESANARPEPKSFRPATVAEAGIPSRLHAVPADSANPAGINYWNIAAALWMSGALVLAVVVAAQALRMGRKLQRGKPVLYEPALRLLRQCGRETGVSALPALYETGAVTVPALTGVLRPRLLLPKGFLDSFSVDSLRHVLLHELAHLRRGDIWWSWVMNLLLIAHWFNPVLWWARRRVLADRECACDAAVLDVLDGQDPAAYGKTMLALAERFVPPNRFVPGLAGMSESSTTLRRRIEMILNFRPCRKRGAVFGLTLALGLGVVCLTDAQMADSRPDLAIERSHIWGSCDKNGETQICAMVTNNGGKAEAAVTFYEGDPAEGHVIGSQSAKVPANRRAFLQVPWDVDYGIHEVSVRVDPENKVGESNENNNSAARQIAFAHGAFIHEDMLTSNQDLPFVNDPELIGVWKSVDFVDGKADFVPGQHHMKQENLYLKELVFLPEGKTSKPWATWTKGHILHSGDRSDAGYEIRAMDGEKYMFYEWMSGDVLIRHMKPSYYVLRKVSGQPPACPQAGAALFEEHQARRQYSHLVVFKPARDWNPKTPREILEVFNKNCKTPTGYFRTRHEGGKLLARICVKDPERVEAALHAEPRLEWVKTMPLNTKLLDQHAALKQESMPE